ncbi:hypothetical protein JHK86_009614 [Glycine max]|nr:hypothetical protein JHK86_009614 [Glycine max]
MRDSNWEWWLKLWRRATSSATVVGFQVNHGAWLILGKATRREGIEILLKDSLSEPDWLSETYLPSEAASSLSECKTLENVEPESSPLSAYPFTLAQRDMLVERAFVC